MSSYEQIIERKRQKAVAAAAAAAAVAIKTGAEGNPQETDGAEQSAPEQREIAVITDPPVSSPPNTSTEVVTPADPKKRARSDDSMPRVYAPQWGVLEDDRIIVPAPRAATIVGPDLCRGLILPADRKTFAKANDLEACTEMLSLLSMVSSFLQQFILLITRPSFSILNFFPCLILGCLLVRCCHRTDRGDTCQA